METHQAAVNVGDNIMICRLVLLDTISNIPVFKLKEGQSILKSSKLKLENCLQYVYILNIFHF